MNRKTSIIFFICCVVIFALFSFFRGSAKNDIIIEDNALSLSYNEFQTKVDYEDIISIGLIKQEDFGQPVEGGSNRSCRWGSWENENLGLYTQYTTMASDYCVMLELKNGELVLLSFEGTESTVILGETLYEMLLEKGYDVKLLADDKQ